MGLYFFLIFIGQYLCFDSYTVAVNVADLMGVPKSRPCCPVNFMHDSNQMSQVLFNEQVLLLSTQGSWSQIEAIEQPNLYNGSWRGYIGWVKNFQIVANSRSLFPSYSVVVPWAKIFSRNCTLVGCLPKDLFIEVSFGTWLEPVGSSSLGWRQVLYFGGTGYILESDIASFISSHNEHLVRRTLIERAPKILGYIYFWGGRSALSFSLYSQGTQLTGLDCSGLVSILYRSCGIIIPRDASKQAIVARKIPIHEMKPGDVFFYGIVNSTAHPVTHVMMLYEVGAVPKLVESAGNSTRILPIEYVYGKPLSKLVWGEKLSGGMNPGVILTWGTFFPFK